MKGSGLFPSSERTPLVFRIDVEPDGFFIDRSRPLPWSGYEAALRFMERYRAELCEATGPPVRLTWLYRADPQIEETYGSAAWGLSTYRASVDAAADCGDEVGLHVHAYRWRSELGGWCLDHGTPAWTHHCLESALTAFAEARGSHCSTFAWGDHWSSTSIVNQLRDSGVRFDLTVEPGWVERATFHPDHPYTAKLPDYRRVPRTPYRPSPHDFRVPASDARPGLWMIPTTTGFYRHSLARKLYYALRRPLAPRSETLALNPSHPPELFRPTLDRAIAERLPVLVLSVRSDVFRPGPDQQNVAANLRWLLRRARAARLVVTTPEDALARLAQTGRAGAGREAVNA